MPALILSPHPDDAMLGCWSALDQPDAATVVNVFAGIPPEGTRGGWDRECGVPDSVEMMRMRRQEDEAALALVGVVPTHLEFLDHQYTDEARDIDAITAAVTALEPQPTAVYAPAAVGGFTRLVGTSDLMLGPHPDHEAAREVGLRFHDRGAAVYLYAEIPYASGDAGETPWPRSIRSFTPQLQKVVGARLELLVVELPPASLARRLDAVRRYATQLPRLEEGVGTFATLETLRYEACWRMPPSRTG